MSKLKGKVVLNESEIKNKLKLEVNCLFEGLQTKETTVEGLDVYIKSLLEEVILLLGGEIEYENKPK